MDSFGSDGDTVMEGDESAFVSVDDLVDVGEDLAFEGSELLVFEGLVFVDPLLILIIDGDGTEGLGTGEEVGFGLFLGEVVVTKNHVLARDDDWFAIFWTKDVVGGKHEVKGLFLRGFSKRDVDRHLVTVEVSVEARADEWVQTDGVAIDKHRLEGLDA